MTSMRAALQHEKEELAANQVEAESRLGEAQMRASFAKRESEQAQSLADAGTLARFELERSVSKAHQEVAAAESAGASVRRIIEQQRRIEREGTGKVQYLQKEAAALAGDQQAIKALIQQLEHQIELLRVCAPVDGIVAEIEPVNPGIVVQSGQRIATILPSGTLKVVAQFPPAAVVGRVKSGQTARLLVDQFPWTQYGAVPLVVTTVGTDAPDGYVRVEFLVDSESHSRIPLQHGLRGTTEVLVERTSPLRVLLRILGRWYVKSAA
jgi:membrane fusion protein (multidrug efflux system)